MDKETLKSILDPYYPTLQEMMCKLREHTIGRDVFKVNTSAGTITIRL